MGMATSLRLYHGKHQGGLYLRGAGANGGDSLLSAALPARSSWGIYALVSGPHLSRAPPQSSWGSCCEQEPFHPTVLQAMALEAWAPRPQLKGRLLWAGALPPHSIASNGTRGMSTTPTAAGSQGSTHPLQVLKDIAHIAAAHSANKPSGPLTPRAPLL